MLSYTREKPAEQSREVNKMRFNDGGRKGEREQRETEGENRKHTHTHTHTQRERERERERESQTHKHVTFYSYHGQITEEITASF